MKNNGDDASHKIKPAMECALSMTLLRQYRNLASKLLVLINSVISADSAKKFSHDNTYYIYARTPILMNSCGVDFDLQAVIQGKGHPPWRIYLNHLFDVYQLKKVRHVVK